jgi:glycosyltransferase involved in cell wall biosynthesis
LQASQIKVLQIIDSLGMGGAETWLMEVLRQWSSDSRHIARMDFLLTSGRPGLFDDEARRLGANLFYVPFQKKHLFTFARELRRILRDGGYDAVHDHADYISGWHFFLGLGRLPAIRVTHVHNPSYQIRNNYGLTLSRRLSTRLGRRLVSKCATVALGTSRQALDEYGFFASPFLRLPKRVLHCGFQLSRFDGDPQSVSAALCKEFGWPPETPVILFAGRLDESLEFDHPRNHKNSAFAVAIFRECLKQEPGLKMILAGANEHVRLAFERRLSDFGLAESVRLLGVRHDIDRLMLGSRLLLFPSRAEGLGMVAVEAQAAGLPVVASIAVPKECVVIHEIVRFNDLSEPVATWAKVILNILAKPRPRPTVEDVRWVGSPFNILVGSNLLQQVYSTGNIN